MCHVHDFTNVSDTLKGSFYNNPTIDSPCVSDSLRQAYPSYYRRNVWPSDDDCPGFEEAFKNLARFMMDVGKKIARACDQVGQWNDALLHPFFAINECGISFLPILVARQIATPKTFEELVSSSSCAKARLLHYFPAAGQ